MGCDGGTIPRRDELVRLKKKPEQKDKDSEREFRWKHCALTQQKLQKPIVMCGLGRLYSKQSIIEYLLEKDSKTSESCTHIKSLKDVKDLNLTTNPAFEANSKDDKHSQFICPLTGIEMSGKFRFVSLWSCGCVLAERALKEIKSNACSVCLKSFLEQDVVMLNGTDDDIDLMRVRMEARVARMKAEKKSSKKSKSKPECTIVSSGEQIAEPTTSSSLSITAKKSDIDVKVNGAASTSSSFKSMVKQSVPNKRALISDKIGDDPVFKKSKDDYSVANDPKATDVYKSIFTSHKSDKTQERAHWVTYNPFYN
uniref:Replication termination factor 2 n=1 Tax=Corethrella appendiculata TaxID=1370023 RepID=U5EYR4_9DIPT